MIVNLILINSEGYPLSATDRVHIEITNPYDGKVVTRDSQGSEHRFELRYHGNEAGDLKVRVSGPYFALLETRLPKHVENRTHTATLTLKPIGWAPSLRTWEEINQCCTELARVLLDDGTTDRHSHYDRLENDNPNSAAGLVVALEYARLTKIGTQSVLNSIRAMDWDVPIKAGNAKVWRVRLWADPLAIAAWRAKQSADFEEARSPRDETWEELGTQFFLEWAVDCERRKLINNMDSIGVEFRFRSFSVAMYENLVYESTVRHVEFRAPLSIYRGWKQMPLWTALFNGTVADLLEYLDSGTKLDTLSPYTGSSLLTVAAETGRSDFVDLLIRRGADVNVERGEPLRVAAKNGSAVMVKSLLAANARQLPGSDGYTPIMVACKSGQTEAVETLISSHADLSMRTNEGESLLELAVRSGRATLVRVLLANGFDPNERTSNRDPLLAIAALDGNVSVLEELLKAGARPASIALAVAAIKGYSDVASILVAHKADVNDGAPLAHAAIEGFTEIVTLLLDAGASPNATFGEGSERMSALTAAAYHGHVEVVEELLRHHADPNLTTSISNPLIAAALEGSPETVLLLLKAGADQSARIQGKTALQFAQERGNHEVAEILKNRRGSASTVPKEFTWELIGKNPRNLRRELLTTSVFSDLALLEIKDIPKTSLNLPADVSGRLCSETGTPRNRPTQPNNVTGRLCSEVTFLISTTSQLYQVNKKRLEATFGPLPDRPHLTLDLIDKGSAGAYMDSNGTLTFDVKLLRANLAASITSAFPELSSSTDSEKVAVVEDLRRKIRMAVGVNLLDLKPNEPGGFRGSLADLPKLNEYEELLDLAQQVMPSDVQYFGTLLFVVAHEMGHIALDHFSKKNVECDDLELQADHFAALLLGESFIALSAKVVTFQRVGVGGGGSSYPMWFLDREALDRYTGFSVFLDKGYEFSKFTGSSTCKYPSPERRLAATRLVLNEIVKSDGDAVIKRIQKRKDIETVLKKSFASRLSFLGISR